MSLCKFCGQDGSYSHGLCHPSGVDPAIADMIPDSPYGYAEGAVRNLSNGGTETIQDGKIVTRRKDGVIMSERPVPKEKNLVDCFDSFRRKMSVESSYYTLAVVEGGALRISDDDGNEITVFDRKTVEELILPFIRGAYGTGLKPSEVEAFQKLTGGKT